VSGTRHRIDTPVTGSPELDPKPPSKAKRAGWAAVVLAVVGGLSQVPWDSVLAFLTALVGGQ
jgi:hypothetical protein